jgi:hypothetical protein
MCISFDEGVSSKKGCGASWLEKNSSYEATLHFGKAFKQSTPWQSRPKLEFLSPSMRSSSGKEI